MFKRGIGGLLLCWLLVQGAWAAEVEVVRDVVYDYAQLRQLDVFLPAGTDEAARPAALLFHGGGWHRGRRQNVEFIARWLAEHQNMVAITVDYSLAPEHPWPAQIIDAAQAVWWLKINADKYQVDPKRIIAMGGSAGGHLAAMLGQVEYTDVNSTVNSRVAGIVSFWGPWNLVVADTERQNKVIKNLLADDSYASRADASPVYKINAAAPPALLFHGSEDTLVPFMQSQQACAMYEAKGLTHCTLVELKGVGHKWPDQSELIYGPLIEFLQRFK